jgi:pimeloyl-CoA dehydrogenase small subunit
MDFELSDDQRLLRDSLDRLLADKYSFEQRKVYADSAIGWNREMWRQYADIGLLGLPFAAEDDGLGGGPVETLLVMEAFGRALALEPYFATVVLGGGFLRLGGSVEQRREFIPQIVAGDLLLAFAHSEQQSRYDLADVATTAHRDGDAWLLSGNKRHVLHGDCADQLIVSARIAGGRTDRQGLALFLVNAQSAGVRRRGYPLQNRLRAADVDFDRVHVPRSHVIGMAGNALDLIEKVTDVGIAALCADAVGCMTQAHDITVAYLKVRKQFGVAIGSFQALQHRAVDMLVMVEQARSMAYYGAMMCEDPDAAMRRRAVSAAKVQIGRSGKFVGDQAIQLHGGIGMTEECQVGHYYRHLTMLEMLLGDSHHHLTSLATAGGLPT